MVYHLQDQHYIVWLWTGDDYSVLLFNANLELSFINLSLGV